MAVNTAAVEREEYQRRLARVRELMAEDGFEVLVVADNDDFFHLPGGHTRYLTDFSLGTRAHVAVVVPAEAEPTLIVPPGPLDCLPLWAEAHSWVRQVRSTPVPGWPPRENLAKDIADTIEVHGLAAFRIGFCGHLPEGEELYRRLPKARVEPAIRIDARGVSRDIIERARAVKSPWEMACLGEAQRYCDAGIQAFMAAALPGVRQDRAIAEAEYQAKRLGAEETLVIMSAGTRPWVWWPYRGDFAFREGDLVAVEFNARARGYVAQIARSWVIGKPTPNQLHVLETAREAERRMIDGIAIGITGGEIAEIGLQVVRQAHLAPFGRYGHGMGLCMSESFDVMAGDDGQVQEGYCIEVHAGVINPDTMDSALIGDQLFVREGNVQYVSPLPQD